MGTFNYSGAAHTVAAGINAWAAPAPLKTAAVTAFQALYDSVPDETPGHPDPYPGKANQVFLVKLDVKPQNPGVPDAETAITVTRTPYPPTGAGGHFE